MTRDKIEQFISDLNTGGINLHSCLITQNGETLYEEYRCPFTADTPHRMYSVTKSFMAVGVGCLIDEGKLSLDSRVADYFEDKLGENVSPEMLNQTVREMLTMKSCLFGVNWFKPEVTDRVKYYLNTPAQKPADSLFSYDSTGSYVLGALCERISGMKLLDYWKLKFLNKIGGFENAQLLETPDGSAWADSALLCTTRALERFSRFVMNEGRWNGEQLVSAEFMRDAVSFHSDTSHYHPVGYNSHGYGYQIWLTEQGGFSFHGMGGQHAIIMPKDRLIFVMTGDNQYNDGYAETVYSAFFRAFYPKPVSPSPKGLLVANGETDSPFKAKIDGKRFDLSENPMGIRWFKLNFDNGNRGAFEYENAQGEKQIKFGFGENLFQKFPQLGYSDLRGNVHEISDFMYDCAVSAGWTEPRKLFIRVQIIDKYFGSLHISIAFRDENTCLLLMVKAAEDFLREYSGHATGHSDI